MQMTARSISGNTVALVALGILAAIIVVATLTNAQLPLISNLRVALIVLLVVGMALCAMGMGITQYGWLNPFTVAGILIGVAILAIGALAFLGVKLPLRADERAAIFAIGVLMVVKVVLAGVRAVVS